MLLFTLSLTGILEVRSQGYTEIFNYAQGLTLSGADVCIDDNYIAVGRPWDQLDSTGSNAINNAGTVYIFQFDSVKGVTLSQIIHPKVRIAGAEFGNAVSFHDSLMVVGSMKDDTTGSMHRGSFYVFEKSQGGNWIEKQKIRASDWQTSKKFGYAVAVYNDRFVVSDPWHGNGWIPSNDRGKLYIYERNSLGVFAEYQTFLQRDIMGMGSDGELGNSLSMYGDYLIAGAPSDRTAGTPVKDGAAHIFKRNSSGQWQHQIRVHGWNNLHSYASFGFSVDIDEDRVVIGAPGDLNLNVSGPWSGSGAAYIYRRSGSNWIAESKIRASNYQTVNKIRFGSDVAISGNDVVVVGKHDTGLPNVYQYFFKRSGMQWTETNHYAPPDFAGAQLYFPSCDIATPLAIIGRPRTDSVQIFFKCSANSYFNSVNLCSGDSIFLQGAYRYSSGVYIDTLKSKFKCDSIVETTLSFDTLQTTVKQFHQNAQVLSVAETGAIYQWIDCATMNPIPNETLREFRPASNGSYAVIVTKGLCTDTSACSDVYYVGIKSLDRTNGLRAYPVPANSELLISGLSDKTWLKITDVFGQVFGEYLLSNSNNAIDVSQLRPGLYFLIVKDQVMRVIIQ